MKDKYLNIFREVSYISSITKVNKKKVRILLSAVLANLTVLLDILIILIFSSFFSDLEYDNLFILFFLENTYLLPFIVLFRFISIYLEKINIYDLQLKISENLKSHLLDEIYKKGNISIADSNFYISSLTNHVSYFYSALSTSISSVLQLISYLVFLLYTDINTIFVFFSAAILLSYPTYYLLKKGRQSMDLSYKYAQKLSQDTERVVENLFLIKILKTKNFEFENFIKNLKNFTKEQLNNYKYGTINSLIPNFLVFFLVAVLLTSFDILKSLTLEFIGVSLRLVQTIGVINQNLNMLINSQVHLEKLTLLEESNKEISSFKYIKNDLTPKKDNVVEIKNMSFKYFLSDQYIFKNLDLSLPSNKHIVVTGPNGSGKSTLLGIIAGALKPKTGKATVMTNNIGYVGVSPYIIPGTLRDNLLYGNKLNKSENEIIDLVKEFKLFSSNDTSVLERTIDRKSLSSGQLQKVSFIRALLADSDLLLLDESTANLDDNSREKIFSILKNKNLTIINCTHNPYDFEYDVRLKVIEGKDSLSSIQIP